MKKWKCDSCGCTIEVCEAYEREYCCNGYMCGCKGMHINPVFCEECEKGLNRKDIMELSDEYIEIRLNQIEHRKCRFSENVDEIEQEREVLINELKRRGYTFNYIDVN